MIIPELGRRAEVLAVVVAEVVVADDGGRLDARRHQEVDEHRLELRLARLLRRIQCLMSNTLKYLKNIKIIKNLKIVAADEDPLLARQLDHPRHERVLGAAVDVLALKDSPVLMSFLHNARIF